MKRAASRWARAYSEKNNVELLVGEETVEGGIPLRAGVHQQRGKRRDIAVPILPFAPPGDDVALGAGMIVAHHLQYRRAHLPRAPPAGRETQEAAAEQPAEVQPVQALRCT